MIRVSVLYQNAEDKKFDMAYYINKHMPMVKQKLGSACKRVDVDQGLGGAQPGSSPRSLPWRTWFSTLWTHFKRHLGLTPMPSWETFQTTRTFSRSFSSTK